MNSSIASTILSVETKSDRVMKTIISTIKLRRDPLIVTCELVGQIRPPIHHPHGSHSQVAQPKILVLLLLL